MTYIVWVNNYTEGWACSDDLETLDEVLNFIHHETYGSPYVVTKVVNVQLIETPKPIPVHPPLAQPFTGMGGAISGQPGTAGTGGFLHAVDTGL